MKKIIIALLLISLALGIASCGCDKYVSKYDESYIYDGTSLIGIWQESEYKDQEYQTYEFFQNGKVICTVYSFGIEMQHIDATYSIDGDNTLVINWKNGMIDRNNFSISNKNVLVICQVLDSKTTEMELVPYNMEYNKSSNDIVGSWRSADNKTEVFTFNQDYTGSASNPTSSYSFHYSLKGTSLFISNEIIEGIMEPVETVEYKVEGDTLTLAGRTLDGSAQVLTFERVK